MSSKTNRKPAAVAPLPTSGRARFPLAAFFATAFVEGVSVLLVEIVGARALAPYFGTSLQVWTAQITATLLFLALGYRSGGWLSSRPSPWNVPVLFWVAGCWLLLYPLLRVPVFALTSQTLGVAVGSFASATLLFGMPLMALGAVSPVLVSYIDRSRPGAGSAVGSLFFVNTLGGLLGGWLTAFVVIPYLPVRLALGGTGAVLVALGAAWAMAAPRDGGRAAGAAAGIATLLLVLVPKPALEYDTDGVLLSVSYSKQSSVGLVQVLDIASQDRRVMLLDGILQGGMIVSSGRSFMHYSAYLDAVAHRFHPNAKDVLVLGVGAGLLCKQLAERGLHVTAVEIDPTVEEVARRFFGLPRTVEVHLADARTALRREPGVYDVIFLDAFAAENVPWYLTTVEAFGEMRSRLTDGGRVVINTVTNRAGNSMGLARIEASLLEVFPQVAVLVEDDADGEDDPDAIVSAVVVAGADLLPTTQPFPGHLTADDKAQLAALIARERSGRATVRPGVDDWDDLDYADAAIRRKWRQLVLTQYGPDLLGD